MLSVLRALVERAHRDEFPLPVDIVFTDDDVEALDGIQMVACDETGIVVVNRSDARAFFPWSVIWCIKVASDDVLEKVFEEARA